MARFLMMYNNPRPGLDAVIEADFYKADGKFFEFFVDKVVVRTLKVDAVLQIKRMAEDEEPPAPPKDPVEQARERAALTRREAGL